MRPFTRREFRRHQQADARRRQREWQLDRQEAKADAALAPVAEQWALDARQAVLQSVLRVSFFKTGEMDSPRGLVVSSVPEAVQLTCEGTLTPDFWPVMIELERNQQRIDELYRRRQEEILSFKKDTL